MLRGNRGYIRFLFLLVLLVTLQACAEDHGSADNPKTGYLYGPVIGITDGDTLTILSPIKKQVKIRLAEIDTPERGQPFGTWAKEQLSDMVFQKDVAIRQVDIDRYDRIVGRIYVGDLDVNAELGADRCCVGLSKVRKGFQPVRTRRGGQRGEEGSMEPVSTDTAMGMA